MHGVVRDARRPSSSYYRTVTQKDINGWFGGRFDHGPAKRRFKKGRQNTNPMPVALPKPKKLDVSTQKTIEQPAPRRFTETPVVIALSKELSGDLKKYRRAVIIGGSERTLDAAESKLGNVVVSEVNPVLREEGVPSDIRDCLRMVRVTAIQARADVAIIVTTNSRSFEALQQGLEFDRYIMDYAFRDGSTVRLLN